MGIAPRARGLRPVPVFFEQTVNRFHAFMVTRDFHFTNRSPYLVDDLVFEDARQPGAGGGIARIASLSAKRECNWRRATRNK